MSSDKKLYILIGQKGSGKSFIGNMIQDLYGIKFINVENIALKVKRDRAIDDESYLVEVFFKIESHLRNALRDEASIIFESTGLSRQFDMMLVNLKMDYRVTTIKVNADENLCIERIHSRDKSTHVNVSDSEIMRINAFVRQKNLVCDYEINNDGHVEDLVSKLSKIFRRE